ncbi:hypothetical protein F5Y17DRAFT_416509 [Xylariaceae sp. FL0594]|nr:hypothetical protein F5Y17DRAFT_416509 [Xylariaceae sp. FL0594]
MPTTRSNIQATLRLDHRPCALKVYQNSQAAGPPEGVGGGITSGYTNKHAVSSLLAGFLPSTATNERSNEPTPVTVSGHQPAVPLTSAPKMARFSPYGPRPRRRARLILGWVSVLVLIFMATLYFSTRDGQPSNIDAKLVLNKLAGREGAGGAANQPKQRQKLSKMVE